MFKKILLILFFLFVVFCGYLYFLGNDIPDNLKLKAADLEEYSKRNGYSTDFGILVDYQVHSGRVRFFLWDFNQEKVVLSSVCAQGCGKGKTYGKNKFSNEVGSKCSSLGHYKICESRMMMKGTRPAYTLYGLDKTNSNAFKRGILLHPVHLPNFTIYPFHIPSKKYRILGWTIRPYSEGCITIPFAKYKKVSKIIKKTNKPVIIWVYK